VHLRRRAEAPIGKASV